MYSVMDVITNLVIACKDVCEPIKCTHSTVMWHWCWAYNLHSEPVSSFICHMRLKQFKGYKVLDEKEMAAQQWNKSK